MPVTNRMSTRAFPTGVSTLLLLGLCASFMLVGGRPAHWAMKRKRRRCLNPSREHGPRTPTASIRSGRLTARSLKASVNGTDYTCKVKVDPEAKPHATIDLTIDDGPEEAKGKISKAIYKLDGEKLTLCVSVPGKDRPKAFEQAPDEAYLFELKKQK